MIKDQGCRLRVTFEDGVEEIHFAFGLEDKIQRTKIANHYLPKLTDCKQLQIINTTQTISSMAIALTSGTLLSTTVAKPDWLTEHSTV